jgi:hypothetical protein
MPRLASQVCGAIALIVFQFVATLGLVSTESFVHYKMRFFYLFQEVMSVDGHKLGIRIGTCFFQGI